MSKPSNYRILHELSEEARNEVRDLEESLNNLLHRMDEQDFDGDYDPTEDLKAKIARAKPKAAALSVALNAAPDDRTPEEVSQDEQTEDEKPYQETAADRKLRWQENGCPGDGPDDY